MQAELDLNDEESLQLEINLRVPAYRALLEAIHATPGLDADARAAFRRLCCEPHERLAESRLANERIVKETLGSGDPYLLPLAVRAGAAITPYMLIAAAEWGLVDLAIELVGLGAPVDGYCGYSKPLTSAIVREDRAMFDALLDLGADPNHTIEGGRSSLSIALDMDDIHLSEALILRGADPQACDMCSLSLLPAERLAWFLDNTSYNIESTNRMGTTLLYLIAREGMEWADEIKVLLARGADPSTAGRFEERVRALIAHC